MRVRLCWATLKVPSNVMGSVGSGPASRASTLAAQFVAERGRIPPANVQRAPAVQSSHGTPTDNRLQDRQFVEIYDRLFVYACEANGVQYGLKFS